jgi:hypothetical protein
MYNQCFYFEGNFLFEGNFNKVKEIIRKFESEGNLKEISED